MIKVNFIPKTDIDEYLNNCYNIEIFNFLTEKDLFCEEPEPLEFLNLFYEQLEIINANKEKPIAVTKHLLGLKLDKIKRFWLLYCLENYIIKCSNIAYEDNETYLKLNTCVDFIEKERKKLGAKLLTIPDGFENTLERYLKDLDLFLKELDLFKKNEPEKYEDFKEISDRLKETVLQILLRKFIEGIEFLFKNSIIDYSGLTVSIARKEIFIREQLEKFEKANLRFKKFGDYANDTINKYQPIFTEALEYWKAELDNLKPFVTALPPQPIKTKADILKAPVLPPPPKEKTLSELITDQNSVKIVEGIKIQYKNIKGKRLKLLLLALQELNLLPKERIAQKFYNCCKAEFGWNVASYTAMNDYQFNDRTDQLELYEMKQYLETKMKAK